MLGQTVPVIVTKPDGNEVGRTQFTYLDKFESTYEAILKSKEWSSFFEEFERQNTTQGNGLINTNSVTLGEVNYLVASSGH